MARTKPDAKEVPQSEGFDARLIRLEAIVAELEDGGIELEPAIERYREGVELLKQCREVLSGYRSQVEELTQSAVRAYGEDPDVDDAS